MLIATHEHLAELIKMVGGLLKQYGLPTLIGAGIVVGILIFLRRPPWGKRE